MTRAIARGRLASELELAPTTRDETQGSYRAAHKVTLTGSGTNYANHGAILAAEESSLSAEGGLLPSAGLSRIRVHLATVR